MNRRERKHMEKQLSLDKFYKKMTREKKFEKMRENQENGRRMQTELKEKIKISLQEQDDQKESDVIANLAENIAQRKKIPVIDAIVEAQEQYSTQRQKK